MATSLEMRSTSRRKAYMDAYARLCHTLTNMYRTERRALDDSVLYSVAMDLVLKGQDREAVEIAKLFRDEAGDKWRAEAAELGLIRTAEYANEVGGMEYSR